MAPAFLGLWRYKMKNKPSFVEILIVLAIVAVVFLCLFFPIYGFIKYGDMPITEVPAWYYFIMTHGGS